MKHRMMAVAALLVTSNCAIAQADSERFSVAFVVWDGMELIESMGPAHVFSFAGGMDAFTVSKTTEPITSEFINLVPQYTFETCPTPDVIVIPGGSIWTPMTDDVYREWLSKHVPRATLVVSVCNSAMLLADLGLLDGKEATCGDSNLDDIMLLGRDVTGYINRRWVHSGNIITSESYLGGVDAAIYAVRVLRGEEGEKRVLAWSSYDGDLSKYDRLHAEPGLVPISRRREIVSILERDGVEAALNRYRTWVASGEPAYTVPLDGFDEQNLFLWMASGLQSFHRKDRALRICQFAARAWPDSVACRARLGEAHLECGDVDTALAMLLEADSLVAGDRGTLALLRRVLHDGRLAPSDRSRQGREILRDHPSIGRARLINPGEPGEPMTVTGRVLDAAGAGIDGARIELFHADAEGWYTKQRAMDEPNARLFGFLRTDADGRFEIETVHPGPNPEASWSTGDANLIPRHLHFVVTAADHRKRAFQMIFSDDPRFTDYWRDWARKGDHPVVGVQRDEDGERVSLDITLDPA